MRLYLEEGKTEKKPDGGMISWPANSFCEVPEELGARWLAEDAGKGLVRRASKDNVAEPKPDPEGLVKMESTTVEPKPLPIENTPVLPPSDAPTVDDIE